MQYSAEHDEWLIGAIGRVEVADGQEIVVNLGLMRLSGNRLFVFFKSTAVKVRPSEKRRSVISHFWGLFHE